MCGFVGIISKKQSLFPEEKLREMTSVIVHRGPDDEGYFQNEWLSFGFRRLKIIDLSAKGHQPMFNAGKTHCIVFNGELYNYCEIREELKGKGFVFNSESDTEVVLNSYICWGRDCLKKFIGMFAFVIADIERKEVFFSRDQLGIKPLFIFEDSGNFIFCSEIKSLLPYAKLEPDFSSFNEYLVFRSLPGENTMFKGVRSLGAGHCGTLDVKNCGSGLRTSQFFNLARTLSVDEDLSFREACEKTEVLFRESVNLHLRSDVELGVQLSGGVDSSLITAVASQICAKRLRSFSISFKESFYDESKYQKRVSEEYNTEHHDYQMDEETFVSVLERAVWHYEYPLNDPNSVCTYYLAVRAKEHITVMLSGEGADESFLGYARFNPESIKILKSRTSLYNNPLFRELMFKIWPFNKGKDLFKVTKYPPSMFALTYADLNDVDRLLKGKFQDMTFRRNTTNSANGNVIDEAILQDELCDLPQWFTRADKMGMAASLEFRVPFCTEPMFRMANSISYSRKVRQGEKKAILKKIAEKYIDKDQIYRKKIGFGTPIDTWINKNGAYNRIFEDTVNSASFKSREFIDHKHFNSLYQAHKSGTYSEVNSAFLWTYFNLELWYRTYFEDGWKNLV